MDNNSFEGGSSRLISNYTQDSSESIDSVSLYVITFLYVLILVTSLIGNSLTCIVIVVEKSMHTGTNCYLFNLAVADILFVAIIVGCKLLNNFLPYQFSDCYIVNCGAEMMGEVSVMTITGLSCERYQAVSQPFKVQSKKRVISVILTMWLLAAVSACLQSTQLYVIEPDAFRPSCVFDSPTIVKEILPTTLVFFILPLVSLSVIYTIIGALLIRSSRERKQIIGRPTKAQLDARNQARVIDPAVKKSLQVSVAIVVAFFVCFTPYHIQRLTMIYYYVVDESKVLSYLDAINTTMIQTPTMLLYVLSGVVNPIIYNVISKKFRAAFKKVLIKVTSFKRKDKVASNTLQMYFLKEAKLFARRLRK